MDDRLGKMLTLAPPNRIPAFVFFPQFAYAQWAFPRLRLEAKCLANAEPPGRAANFSLARSSGMVHGNWTRGRAADSFRLCALCRLTAVKTGGMVAANRRPDPRFPAAWPEVEVLGRGISTIQQL
jgi:hypothetical protein